MRPFLLASSRSVAVVLFACGAFAAQTPGDADALFARGVELHRAGDVLGAIEAYQAALEIDASRVDARSNLGAAFVRLGRYGEAIDSYRAVLARVPQEIHVRFNLALALYKANRTGPAAEEFEKVTQQEPGNLHAVLLLADCRSQMGDDAGVLSLLLPHESELKDDRLYAYLLGNALIRRNDLLRGQSYIDQLFKGGETAQGHLLLGAAHLRGGDNRSAVLDLQRAVELDPALATAHSLLGRALIAVGRRDEAIQAFGKELEKNPNDFDSNLYRGLMLKDEGRLDEAYEHVKRAGRLRPDDPGVLYIMGALHLAAGRDEEARIALERLTTDVPNYRQAHVLLAQAYYREKNKEQGDRHRAIAEKLGADEQAQEPGAADDLGPAYRGGETSPAGAGAAATRGKDGGARP